MFKIISYPFLLIGSFFLTIAIVIRIKFNPSKLEEVVNKLEAVHAQL